MVIFPIGFNAILGEVTILHLSKQETALLDTLLKHSSMNDHIACVLYVDIK
jgi:hypothetical protein